MSEDQSRGHDSDSKSSSTSVCEEVRDLLRQHEQNAQRRSRQSKIDALSVAGAALVYSLCLNQVSAVRAAPLQFLTLRGLASLFVMAIAAVLATRAAVYALRGAIGNNREQRITGLAELPSAIAMVLVSMFLSDLYSIWSSILKGSPLCGYLETVLPILIVLFAFLAGWLRGTVKDIVRKLFQELDL